MIWLIDYNHYKKEIDSRLNKCKQDYFIVKSYKRFNIIGETAPVKTKTFSNGLLRLATILDANGICVRYMHYNMLEFALNNGEPLPETIAFSAVCPTVPLCAALAQRIKAVSPKTKVMIGGAHINVAAKETANRYPIFDKLVIGYEMDAAQQLTDKKLTVCPKPYVNYSLLPFSLADYAINTFTTMGCPFSCNYCVDGRAPHFFSSENGQLDEMVKLLPLRTLVHFFDSVLGYSRDGLKNVCKQIEATKHNFVLSCDMRADMIDLDAIYALESAGFVEIRLGMESSDSDLLKKNGRTLMYRKLMEKLELLYSKSKLYVTLYTITGLPGTTWEIQENTLKECDYLLSSGLVDEIKNSLYVPYPMEGVDYSTRGVTILNDNWEDYDRQSYPVYRTVELSSAELWEMYIKTAESINTSWLKSIGFSDFSEVPYNPTYYSEYIIPNYLKDEGE
ncbi:MAG: cobalamin-dependent protein [Clostridia bacterium]|nr:cobalamin-dependent protein [Clostridia bacterium]